MQSTCHHDCYLSILLGIVLEVAVQIIDVELPGLDEVGGVKREQLPLGFFSIEVGQIYLETTCLFSITATFPRYPDESDV